MNTAAIKRLTLENAIRKGLERREFYLEYQPQVNVISGRIDAVEALVRWRHPEEGRMYPDKFISIAEETGLIVPLGEWVIDEACQQTQLWHQAGFRDLTVSVNVSAMQLNRLDLQQVVAGALDRSGLAPEYLEIELTETSILRAEHVVSDILKEIKKLGVKVAMDDFGTGYSSLSYLRKLPIDKLKVDQSFVRDIINLKDTSAIISAIVRLAHSLNLHVTAEGVDNMAQYEFLRREGCDFIQGFLYSAPVCVEDITQMLKSSLPAKRAHLRPVASGVE
jgi:EAL domain-containing protein (putative c-di-GMP-specific phosphodiesterase class I)